MPRPGIPWTATVAIAVVACAALACHSDPPGPAPWGGTYARRGCAGCHGPRGQGGPAAPPLGDLGRHWGEGRLIAYFRDPDAVKRADPRLEALSGSYPLRMPPVRGAGEDELRALARELLVN